MKKLKEVIEFITDMAEVAFELIGIIVVGQLIIMAVLTL